MNRMPFCRIGVFYDGSYFNYAQRYFYFQRELGWLDFRPFHALIESYVRAKEQGYSNYRVVYASWFQGLFPSGGATEQQLRFDRNLNVNQLETDKDFKATFKGLFRKPEADVAA